MYADDTAISFSSDNIEEIDAVLNADLACLEKWLQGNKVSLNVVKTQAMIMGSSQKLRKIDTPVVPIPHFQVNGNDINLVKETIYLGLMIDDNLKLESNVINTQKKISRAIGLLKYANTMCKSIHYGTCILVLFNHISAIVALFGDVAGQLS